MKLLLQVTLVILLIGSIGSCRSARTDARQEREAKEEQGKRAYLVIQHLLAVNEGNRQFTLWSIAEARRIMDKEQGATFLSQIERHLAELATNKPAGGGQ